MPQQPALYPRRHAVVLAHPNPQSFNGLVANAWCEAVRACGQEAIVRDLYALGFDPLLKDHERPGRTGFHFSTDVEAELDAIRGCDVLVLVYPIWFGMPPAMMAGYVDRVLGAGVTADQVHRHSADTLLRGKRLVCVTSSGLSGAWLDAQMAAMREQTGRYLQHAFGMASCAFLHFGETVDGLDQAFVDANLVRVDDCARTLCALPAPA